MLLIGADLKMFSVTQSVWDKHRGQQLPSKHCTGPTDDAGLQGLVDSLEQSHWAESTRSSYCSWVNDWCNFTALRSEAPLPANERTLCQFLVFFGNVLLSLNDQADVFCTFSMVAVEWVS